MEKLLYSKKGKGIALIIHNVSIVIITACVTLMVLFSSLSVSGIYGNYRYGLNLFQNNNKFEDTDLCYYLLSDSIDEIIRYTVIREQMETKGVFDGNKPIDIEEYAKRYQFGSNKSNVCYRLEDLIKWGQYGLGYEEDTAYGIDGYSSSVTTGQELLERYKPIGGKSLKDYVTSEQSYEQLCEYLSESISSLSYNYYQYRQFQNSYNENKTNIRYYIVTNSDQGRAVYTNLPANMNVTEAEKYIKSIGKYVVYDAQALSFDTNTDIYEEELTDMLNGYEYAYSDDYQVMIGLDTTYPINDPFAIGKGNFYAIIPWLEPLMVATVICSCLAFLCFVYMTIVTGKREHNGEVQLSWFDAINTEGAAVIATMLCGAVFCVTGLVTSWCYYSDLGKVSILISVSIGAFFFHVLFLYFYLSLVRRIKNKSLWKNSISRKVFHAMRSFAIRMLRTLKHIFFRLCDNGKITARTWVPYLIFLLVNLILMSFGRVGILLAALFDLIVGGYLFNENKAKQKIVDGIDYIKNGDMSYQIDTFRMHGDTLILAEAVNTLGDAVRNAVETSMKDERLKADLITNVSHDIKTPLTSIINYVDLIKRENIENEKIKDYIAILDAKSQRLKHLTEDLVEASKISSGNVTLQLVRMNLVELLYQTTGEFTENFNRRGLRIIMNVPNHPVVIEADSRCIWRVIENLFKNIEKYAMENTRIYIDMTEEVRLTDTLVHLSIKNISKQPLNIKAEDLTERFIRGDISRSTEGSGLGLSIAKNLMQLQNGGFEIYLDGDLFKVMLTFIELLN